MWSLPPSIPFWPSIKKLFGISTPPNKITYWDKGEWLGTGVSGIVELLDTGHVIKSPWPEDEQCRADIAREAQVYKRLSECFGVHERFVRMMQYDATQRTITMEYMVNGNLREYLEKHHNIPDQQRYKWACALAKGMKMLHAISILHCDFTPRNMLLDETLELKIADFGCAAIDGLQSSGGGSTRFYLPNREQLDMNDDIFALGSSIFEVMTSKPPYMEINSAQIRRLYCLQQFPELVGVELNDIIRDCWLSRAHSAQHVYQRIV